MEDRQSQAAELHSVEDLVLDDHDFVPHFQRVSISGEDTSGVPLEDLERASRLVIQALELRERHMSVSQQSFPATTARFLKSVHEKTMSDTVEYEDKRTTAGRFCMIFVCGFGVCGYFGGSSVRGVSAGPDFCIGVGGTILLSVFVVFGVSPEKPTP